LVWVLEQSHGHLGSKRPCRFPPPRPNTSLFPRPQKKPRQLLAGIGFPQNEASPLQCDNNGALVLTGDPSFHARVKHIDVRYHHIRDRVEAGEISMHRVGSKFNTSDILTKALPASDFTRLRDQLGLRKAVRAEGECGTH